MYIGLIDICLIDTFELYLPLIYVFLKLNPQMNRVKTRNTHTSLLWLHRAIGDLHTFPYCG